MLSADDVIRRLDLKPHPEGGHFRETWREGDGTRRGAGTAIYFLLQQGERSHWHRVDAAGRDRAGRRRTTSLIPINCDELPRFWEGRGGFV